MRRGFRNNARQSLGAPRAVPGAVRTGARYLYGAGCPPSCHPLKGGGMTGGAAFSGHRVRACEYAADGPPYLDAIGAGVAEAPQ